MFYLLIEFITYIVEFLGYSNPNTCFNKEDIVELKEMFKKTFHQDMLEDTENENKFLEDFNKK